MPKIVDYPIVFICAGCGKDICLPSPEGTLGLGLGDPCFKKDGKYYCRSCWKKMRK
jgi:hypothetical protein